MNILILGSGGREHALVWRLSQDESCKKIYAWPGNPGMESPKLTCLEATFNKENLKDILEIYRIDLVIPGAEKFLYEGVANWCETWNVPCFGPKVEAAKLERSKLFSKEVMSQAGIPTAAYRNLTFDFHKDFSSLNSVLQEFKRPVIKLSGPALGKGVFVCKDQAEALEVLNELKRNPMPGLSEGLFVEEGLRGEEISLFYACQDDQFLFLGAAQDHKRLKDQDEGPNTGGMGAYSPVSWATQDFLEAVTRKIVRPTLREMKVKGTPFRGVLFLGLMVHQDEINLLEYNVRFGDPETQVILPLIKGDLSLAIYRLCLGLIDESISIDSQTAIHVVKAAKGYPGLFGVEIEKGQPIQADIMDDPASIVFYAGVRKTSKGLLTDGGRVLGITALGSSKQAAREKVYKRLGLVRFPGEHFRTDIGAKA